jgi:GcrA cell cycle regulator
MGASVWDTEGIVDDLKKLVGERLSSSRIAAALSFKYNVDLTRNAVISKVWRIGMSGSLERPRSPSQRKKPDIKPGSRWHIPPPNQKQPQPPRRALEMAPEPMPFAIVEEVVVPEKERVGVEGLGQHQCRWPIGDPQSPDFHFCHHKRIGGISYCEIHARRAYRPIEEQPREIRIAARTPAREVEKV